MATTFLKLEPEYDNEPGNTDAKEWARMSDVRFKPHENPKVWLTSFYGGKNNGRSLQLTLDNGLDKSLYSLLTLNDVVQLRDGLNSWIEGDQLPEIE